MWWILPLILNTGVVKAHADGFELEARIASIPIKIDGILEDVWYTADTVNQFTQFSPHYGEQPAESTYVFVLYDKENLYVAFVGFVAERDVWANLGGAEDYVNFYIDTFLDRTTAYGFGVGASGSHSDALILNDGRSEDASWDGVWYCASKVYPDRFVVEIRVPFKSIRYKRGLNEWGINFHRRIPTINQTLYWKLPDEREGLRVSKFGILKGIHPGVVGRNMEIYPIGFVRSEHYTDTSYIWPDMGVNFNWSITPELRLSLTYNPDFAQIEADPFSLNLSRYELYLRERRPFFLEGMEIFQPASFGRQMGFYDPIQVFYSRRIGKKLPGGVEVPIKLGMKLTGKGTGWQTGLLYVYTDSTYSEGVGEPPYHWSVLRYKHQVLGNSEIGFLAVSKSEKLTSLPTYAMGIDLGLRNPSLQFVCQAVATKNDTLIGYAFNSGIYGFYRNYMVIGRAQSIGDKFDISELGYYRELPGTQMVWIIGGPMKLLPKGKVKMLHVLAGGGMSKYKELPRSYFGALCFGMNLRPTGGFSINVNGGKIHEEVRITTDTGSIYTDTLYFMWSTNFNYWSGPRGKISYYGGFNLNRSWIWGLEWLSYQLAVWCGVEYSITPRVSFSIYPDISVYFTPENRVHLIFTHMEPRLGIYFNPYLQLTLRPDIAIQWEGTTRSIPSLRLGYLLSWEIAPKSYLYVVMNDEWYEADGRLHAVSTVSAIKLKWLQLL